MCFFLFMCSVGYGGLGGLGGGTLGAGSLGTGRGQGAGTGHVPGGEQFLFCPHLFLYMALINNLQVSPYLFLKETITYVVIN